MITKVFSTAILSFLLSANLFAQQSYQTLTNAGIKIKCGCKLYTNSTFIELSKKQGMNNIKIKGSYMCVENEDNPDKAAVYNINVYDNASDYIGISPSNHSYFEKKVLENYAVQLKNANIPYSMTTFNGVSAIEYTTYQFDDVPTKAIYFFKNKTSYLLQVGTRDGVNTKFNALKASFIIID